MEKLEVNPSRLASLRRMRTQALWKVITHMALDLGPMSLSTRSFISLAALLVKVIARISCGCTSRSESR